ncbi:MAG: tRNA-binding protein [Candidatus Aenigmarchaeota archaeon]|nr:tRNA-binding protein [Candidatus Aenigmarchaeota archaeon]
MTITYEDFQKVDIRVGKILAAEDFPEAKKPALKLTIDFGELGVKRSSAQISHYKKENLTGRLILCVVNFEKKQIGPFVSEVLTLGVSDDQGRWNLIRPDNDVPLGGRMA